MTPNSTSPISIASRTRHDRASPRLAGKIVIARLRDLGPLLPALALLIVIGAIVVNSGVPDQYRQHQHHPHLLGGARAGRLLAESLIVITGKFDLSLESTAGFAPAIRPR